MKKPLSRLFEIKSFRNNYLALAIATAFFLISSCATAQSYKESPAEAAAGVDTTRKLQPINSDGFYYPHTIRVGGALVPPQDTVKLPVRWAGAKAYKNGANYEWTGTYWRTYTNDISDSTGVDSATGLRYDPTQKLIYLVPKIDSLHKYGDSLYQYYNGDSSFVGLFGSSTPTLLQVSYAGDSTDIPLKAPGYWIYNEGAGGYDKIVASDPVSIINANNDPILEIEEGGQTLALFTPSTNKSVQLRTDSVSNSSNSDLYWPDGNGVLLRGVRVDGVDYLANKNGIPDLGTISGGGLSFDESANTINVGSTINPYGSLNTIIGFQSATGATPFSGTGNTGLGFQSLYTNTSGNSNTAIGTQALQANHTGDNNTAIGETSLNGTTSGYNTGVGASSLSINVTGTYNTGIGFNANTISDNLTNATAIGANALIGISNAVSIGDSTAGTKVGIGTAYPTELLEVNGKVKATQFVGDGSLLTGISGGSSIGDSLVYLYNNKVDKSDTTDNTGYTPLWRINKAKDSLIGLAFPYSFTSLANGDMMVYNTANSRWQNSPFNAGGNLSYAASTNTLTLSATPSFTSVTTSGDGTLNRLVLPSSSTNNLNGVTWTTSSLFQSASGAIRMEGSTNARYLDISMGSSATTIIAKGSTTDQLSIRAGTSTNNAILGLGGANQVMSLSRNIADANSAFTITQTHASATGNLITGVNSSGTVYQITQAGAVSSLYERFGSGSPEGVVTAPVGAVYHRTDGGAGTSFYVKESGTGNTGWVAK